MTNRKLIIVTILLIILLSMLIGCADAKASAAEYAEPEGTFVIVEATEYWFTMYHRDTKVMYVGTKNVAYMGGLTVMLDAHGDPVIYGKDYSRYNAG
jgi:hypothetical protein